jgi:hypothetical protein
MAAFPYAKAAFFQGLKQLSAATKAAALPSVA